MAEKKHGAGKIPMKNVKTHDECSPSELYQQNIRMREELEGTTDYKDGSLQTNNCVKKFLRICWKGNNLRNIGFILMILVLMTLLIIVIVSNVLLKTTSLPNQVHVKSDPLTIGKIEGREVEICQGNYMKRSFPDFDYATYGYNIIYGYPLATGHDPGLTHPIFEADYSGSKQTADCRYQIPHGYHLVPDVACVTSFTSETVKDASQFSKSLSVSAEVSGGGWGVSFSASADYKKKSSVMSASESVFIFSKAACNYYFAKLNEQNPPALSSDFINYVKNLKTAEDTHRLFNYYGTHFMTYTLFGARFIYEYKMSQKSFKEESSEDVSVSVKASYSGLFSLGGGFGMSSSNSQSAQNFLSKVETKTISIGAPPPANGDTMTWASTVKDTPIPVEYKLESIENLFTEQYMKGANVNYEHIRELIELGKMSYCESLMKNGVVDGCKSLSDYFSFDGVGVYGGEVKYYTERQCIERCREDNLCFAINLDTKNPNICYLYRKPKNSIKKYKDNFYTSDSQTAKVIIFFDALKLLDYSFKLRNIHVKDRVQPREKLQRQNETMCMKKCKDDAICSVFTYNPNASSTEKNCFLYSLGQVSCEEEKCKLLEKSDSGSMTQFNVY